MSPPEAKDIVADVAENVVRAIGLVFNNTSLYSPKHSVTKDAVDEGYRIVSETLDSCSELMFTISEDTLIVNGAVVQLNNPLLKMFAKNLIALEIGSFSFLKGMERATFDKIMDVMNTKPEDLKAFGGFGAAIKSFNLTNVKATTITVKQVAEDEVVMAKDGEGNGGAVKQEEEADMMAFIKGDIESSDAIAKNLSAVATDSNKLSEMIIQAADVSDKVADLSEGDSFSTLIISSLKRVYDAIASDPSFKTQKGKKALKKALQALEMTIFETLKENAAMFTDADRAAIANSIETMTDELEIESLAAEYMRKRSAIENNENRILRYIRSKGLDKIKDSDLEDKLNNGGLSLDGWQELLAKSGIDDFSGDESATGIAAVGHLAMLLDQMESGIKDVESVSDAEGKGPDLEHLMTDVDKEVQKMVVRTEKKIKDLVRQVQDDDKADEGDAAAGKKAVAPGKKRMSRKKLLERLAEVVQELCQPIAVVHCTIEMILGGCVGDVTDQQKEMLVLADESGQKLQLLIDHLLEISGVPKTLKPDRKIQDSIYEKQG